MNVWLRVARKKATCSYDGCLAPEHEISSGEYLVVCQWYMHTRSGKHWLKRKLYHPQCWIDQAIAELKQRPVIETRGHQKMAITDADREQRLRTLRKRASIVQRLKVATDASRILHLIELLEKCSGEIEQYGGVPTKW